MANFRTDRQTLSEDGRIPLAKSDRVRSATFVSCRSLERMVSGRAKAHELETLLPWAWKAEHAAAVVGI